MRPPAQTRLSVRLTVSQMARVGEIECLIIIICRRLSTNLEKNDAIRVCEYLLSGQEHRGAACHRCRLADISRTHSSQVVSVLNARASVRPYIDTNGGSSFKLSEEREGAMSQLGDKGFLRLFIAEL